jgi:hypothetical protein
VGNDMKPKYSGLWKCIEKIMRKGKKTGRQREREAINERPVFKTRTIHVGFVVDSNTDRFFSEPHSANTAEAITDLDY